MRKWMVCSTVVVAMFMCSSLASATDDERVRLVQGLEKAMQEPELAGDVYDVLQAMDFFDSLCAASWEAAGNCTLDVILALPAGYAGPDEIFAKMVRKSQEKAQSILDTLKEGSAYREGVDQHGVDDPRLFRLAVGLEATLRSDRVALRERTKLVTLVSNLRAEVAIANTVLQLCAENKPRGAVVYPYLHRSAIDRLRQREHLAIHLWEAY